MTLEGLGFSQNSPHFAALCKCLKKGKPKINDLAVAKNPKEGAKNNRRRKGNMWRGSGQCYWCQILRHWRGRIDSTRTWLKYRKCFAIKSKVEPRRGGDGSANNVLLMLFVVWWEFNYENPSICHIKNPGRERERETGGKMRDIRRQMRHAIQRNVLSSQHLSWQQHQKLLLSGGK